MTGVLERLGVAWLDLAASALVLSTASVLAMVACRQPARRLVLARATLAGLVALPILSVAWPWRAGALAPLADAAGADGRRVLGALALVNAAGVAVGLSGLALGLAAVARLRGRSREASEDLKAIYRDLTDGPRSAPALRVSERVGGPALLGVARPTIFVPASWDEPGRADDARLGLRHELAHHDRRDPAFGLLGALAGALWFFLPTVWWVRAQMRLDQEFLADGAASEDFGSFGAYASTLVALADPSRGGGAAGPRGSRARGSGPPLRLRVLMLVRRPFALERHPSRLCRGALAGLVGALTLVAASVGGQNPGAGEPAEGPRPAPHGRFRVARLALDPPRVGADGQAKPYPLMARLPPHFTLTARVLAESRDLERFRLVGQRLGPVEPGRAEPPDGLHDVRIERDAAGVRVWVDGQGLPSEADRLGAFVSLQPPPGHAAVVQDLILTW